MHSCKTDLTNDVLCEGGLNSSCFDSWAALDGCAAAADAGELGLGAAF